jgi:hypothetical protein
MESVIVLGIVCIPLLCVLIARRRAQEKARRIAAYRASPESHILNLHD